MKKKSTRKKTTTKPLTNEEGEVRELTAADFRLFRPGMEVDPRTVLGMIADQERRGRGPQKAPTKELVSLRLDPDVLAALRARGRGWQTFVNKTLRLAIAQE